MKSLSVKATVLSLLIAVLFTSVSMVFPQAAAAYTWTSLGTTGSSVDALLYHPGDEDLYAGCQDADVYLNHLPGTSWSSTGTTPLVSVECLVRDTNSDRIFAAGANGHVTMLTVGGGWMDLGDLGHGLVYSLAYDTVSDVLYAACADQHIYRSSPVNPWTDVGSPGSTFIYDLVIDTDRRVLYAGLADGSVYRKTLPALEGVAPGFCMHMKVSKLFRHVPSARKALLAGATAPRFECPPVQAPS